MKKIRLSSHLPHDVKFLRDLDMVRDSLIWKLPSLENQLDAIWNCANAINNSL